MYISLICGLYSMLFFFFLGEGCLFVLYFECLPPPSIMYSVVWTIYNFSLLLKWGWTYYQNGRRSFRSGATNKHRWGGAV